MVNFPIRLAFAMTINKSQGKKMSVCDLNLCTPCFSHGQLYVACSQVGKLQNSLEITYIAKRRLLGQLFILPNNKIIIIQIAGNLRLTKGSLSIKTYALHTRRQNQINCAYI
ncbi:ATP-dependent DNA helicase PIF1-like [Aphis craccivora]|uniref:ATP-dependent DNA helicase PIF1-like n=1 Tax=Aphis craccivora TaxID=307492 RepID=A0A6G0XHI7_APHCR|nr:ATP-dependent DNA helicase PIF1-like [Aphis craccivora]